MKKCVIIGHVDKSKYRIDQLDRLIDYFNSRNVDVILTSSEHISERKGVKNYITTKNVTEKFYTSELYQTTWVGEIKRAFMQRDTYNNNYINPRNFFIKRFNITSQYAYLLDYDYVYLMESDVEIRKDYFDEITKEDYDYENMKLYSFGYEIHFSASLLHGPTSLVKELFSDKMLQHLEKIVSDGVTVCGIEHAISNIKDGLESQISDRIDVITDPVSMFFEKFNTASSSNIADIFFDKTQEKFFFLMMKGDRIDNTFSCELFSDDTIIHSQTIEQMGIWFSWQLETNRSYKIKYYEGQIDEYYLSYTKEIFTDPQNTELHNNTVEDYVD
jgi:hypothetical protein